MDTVLSLLPKKIQEQFRKVGFLLSESAEELRIRIGRPLEWIAFGKPNFLPYITTEEDAWQLLNHISQFSLYTLEEELKRGYITVSGGHRIGLAGKVVLENGTVKAIRDVSSFNIRIARQKVGVADHLIPGLYENGEWKHTLIIGAPQTGKTTLLRDIARIISSGSDRFEISPQKVGIVDERSEIAGCVNGVPQLEFGPRVDVLDGCPKAEGMMMMIRSMSPEVLVVDEIGREEDTLAVLEAVNAGIKLIITTHGHTLSDIERRPFLATIIEQHIFERFIELKHTEEGRQYKIFNSSGLVWKAGASWMWTLIGAALILITTTWAGFEGAKQLSERSRQLRLLKLALQSLEAEIMYGQTPLEAAALKLSKQLPGPLSLFFVEFANRLGKGETTVKEAWEESLLKIWSKLALKQGEFEILSQFGETLGRHDRFQQQKQIQLALTHLEREESDALDKQSRYEKMVKSLGFLSGLLLIILLI